MENIEFTKLIQDEHWDAVKVAINNGYNLNTNDAFGAPIMLEFGKAPVDVIELCLKKGAILSAWIISCFVSRANIDVISYLIESKIDLNLEIKVKEDFNVLLGDLLEELPLSALAGYPGDELHETKLKIAKLLLDNGMNIDATDTAGRTALHLAAIKGDIETIKFLLDNGASKKIKDIKNKRAFHLADKDEKELKALIK